MEKTKIHPYITIDGEEPTVPVSFFHTRKFLYIGIVITVIAVLLKLL